MPSSRSALRISLKRLLAASCLALLGAVALDCRSAPRPAPAALTPRTDSLSSRSSITCQTEGDCAVCYRAGTCGEPIAATDAERDAPACHVSPAPFCLPRRARCENHVCVAR